MPRARAELLPQIPHPGARKVIKWPTNAPGGRERSLGGLGQSHHLPVPSLHPVSTHTRGCSAQFKVLREHSARGTREISRGILRTTWLTREPTVSRVKMVKLYFRQVLKNHQLEQGLFHDIIFVMCSYLFINTPSQSNTKQHPIPCQMTNYLMIALSLNSQLIYRVSQTLTYFHK